MELREILEVLFPSRCPVCGRIVLPKGTLVHNECRPKIKVITEPFCIRCGKQLSDSRASLCELCSTYDFHFDAGRSVFPYKSSLSEAIRTVKTLGLSEYVEFFADLALATHKDFLQGIGPAAVVPIPLHKSKLKKRGFNQAELLGQALAQRIGADCLPLLSKVRKTREQKGLSRIERISNLSGAYEINEAFTGNVPRTVILVDDIFTTGSTIDECARVLKEKGVIKVYFICFATGAAD